MSGIVTSNYVYYYCVGYQRYCLLRMTLKRAICLLNRPQLEFHKCIAFDSISCLAVAIVSKGLANMFNVQSH